MQHSAVLPADSGVLCRCGVPPSRGSRGCFRPPVVSAPPGAAHACANPARPARPGTGCGSGAAGFHFRDLGFRGCSPAAQRGPAPLPPGGRLARIPGGSRIPSRHRSAPTPPGGWTGRGGPSAPGLSPTWHRFQLGLYLRSREGERHKPRKRCGQANHGQQPPAPRLCWGAGFGAFLTFRRRGAEGEYFLSSWGRGCPEPSTPRGRVPRVPLASALDLPGGGLQLPPAAPRFPPVLPRGALTKSLPLLLVLPPGKQRGSALGHSSPWRVPELGIETAPAGNRAASSSEETEH